MLAIAVVHRDLEGLRAELEFERSLAANASVEEAAFYAPG
jgi:hypothetical protein